MNTDNPENSEPNGHTASPAPAEHPPHSRETGETRLQPRSGPIVWGVLVLVFCVYSVMQLLAPGSLDTTVWVIATTIGLGVLLLAVGVAVLLRGRR